MQVEQRGNMRKERIYRSASTYSAHRMRVRFLDFHRMVMSGSLEYPKHRHEEYELILVEEGLYRCKLNDTELSLSRGEALLIQPGDEHQDHLKLGQQHYVLHFNLFAAGTEEPVERVFAKGVDAHSQVAEAMSGGAYELFAMIARESAGRAFASNVQDALLEALLWKLLRAYPQAVLDPRFVSHSEQQQFIESLYGLIYRSLKERLPLRELAAQMKMPVRSLNERCRMYLGCPPSSLIRAVKMEEAERLLASGQWSVKATAYELGFANPFHFSQVFKKLRGRSPSEVSKAQAD